MRASLFAWPWARLARLGVVLAVAAVVGFAGSAVAAPAVRPAVELSVIHALLSDAGGSIDPRLRDLPQLTRDQPFVRYNVYKLLDRSERGLEVGKPLTSTLVNGRTLQVTLVDVVGEKSDRRFHVRAEIGEPGKTAFLKLLEVTASGDEPFFVGGQSYDGGKLFLEFVVRP